MNGLVSISRSGFQPLIYRKRGCKPRLLFCDYNLGIIANVLSEFLQRTGTSHNVIERFLLPEGAMLTKGGINLARCKGFPGMHNPRKKMLAEWYNELMNVVRHNDEFIQLVTIVIEI